MKKLYLATLGLSMALATVSCTKEKSDAQLVKEWQAKCLKDAGELFAKQKHCADLEKHARVFLSHGKSLPRKGKGSSVTIDEEKLAHFHHNHRKQEKHKSNKREAFRNCVGAAYAEHHLTEKDFDEVVSKCRKKYKVHMTKEELEELEGHVVGGITSYQTKRLEHRLKTKKKAAKKAAKKAHKKEHAKKHK